MSWQGHRDRRIGACRRGDVTGVGRWSAKWRACSVRYGLGHSAFADAWSGHRYRYSDMPRPMLFSKLSSGRHERRTIGQDQCVCCRPVHAMLFCPWQGTRVRKRLPFVTMDMDRIWMRIPFVLLHDLSVALPLEETSVPGTSQHRLLLLRLYVRTENAATRHGDTG